ncbi:hypothetical protein ACWD2L_00390 [Streptomyces sp. NPDC002754]
MPLFLQLLLTAVIVFGASARITRILGADKITAPLRAKLTVWTKSTRAADFLVCPWCCGFWVSLAVTYIAWLVNSFPILDAQFGLGAVGLAFGTSYFVGLLADLEEDDGGE